MLQKLNERIQGVVAWIVIILIALTFTLFGVDYYMQSRQASNAEVDVNGQEISKQAFETNYRRSRQQRDPSQITAASEQAIKQQVLSSMITNEVSVQAARAAGFNVSVEQARTAILNIPQFQEDGHFSLERFQQALSNAMFTPDSFRAEVMQGMLLNQQRFAFIGSSFVLPGEIKRFVKLYMQTRDYDFLKISASNFVNTSKVTEEAISDYYQKNQNEFLAPEKISVNFVRLSMGQIKDKITVNEEQIKRYYDDNQSSYLTPAQWQVAHILFTIPKDASADVQEQIKQKADDIYQSLQSNPEKFSELVTTVSDDKLSVANKGVLPWIVAGQTTFDKALADLTEPEQIAAPVKSNNGYEIFKLVSYKPATLKSLKEVQSDIKNQLQAELIQAKYAQLLEQLGDLSYQSPDSLSPVADTLQLKIEESKLFSRSGGSEDLTKNTQLVNTAFSHDVLELGNNSEPLQLDNDTVVVLRVNKHIAATEKPLAKVRDNIVKKLALVSAKEEAEKLGAEILAARDEPAKQESLIKSNKLQWHSVNKAGRESDKTDSLINDLAFSLASANLSEGRSLDNGDYSVVRLLKINNGHYDQLDKEQQANIAQQIESNYGVMDYDLFVNSLMAKAKIINHSKP